MSEYRELSENHEIEILEKILKRKKLTEKQRKALKSILRYYYSRD